MTASRQLTSEKQRPGLPFSTAPVSTTTCPASSTVPPIVGCSQWLWKNTLVRIWSQKATIHTWHSVLAHAVS